uniref:Uncharacterized protein n=1 Tax=Arundo donax TaxID=35708 RepID=A0A0A8ZA91_ARUDO
MDLSVMAAAKRWCKRSQAHSPTSNSMSRCLPSWERFMSSCAWSRRSRISARKVSRSIICLSTA